MSAGRLFGAVGNVSVGPNKTAIHVIPGTVGPIYICAVVIGCQVTPTSQAARWVLIRSTADGTGTAVTPQQINGTGAASRCTATVNHSAEPTYATFQTGVSIPLNQQATIIWQANPGKEFELVPSSVAGAGIKTADSTGTAVHSCQLMWEE